MVPSDENFELIDGNLIINNILNDLTYNSEVKVTSIYPKVNDEPYNLIDDRYNSINLACKISVI